MSYTQIAILALALTVVLDLIVLRTRLLTRKAFWTSYAIILPFQILTNWWLTSRKIVIYDEHKILGPRIIDAPLEDIAFGFSLILGVLSLWVFWGRCGIDRQNN
ncbi:MAG: lycopene cyclase domain-containing protein [Actinomycetota bacterium]